MISKDEILDELRRTARENGGKSLGHRRFREVTAITPHDWGRYWARFSDAQLEAGLEPNRLNPALDDAFLMKKYVGLVRALGKVPTAAELRVERNNDPQFPNAKSFTRMGNKRELLLKVIAYCEGEPDYADVSALCEAALPSNGASFMPETKGDSVTIGFVYLARGHPGEYKIGRTNLVDRRVSEVGATLPVELELVHEIKTDDPVGVEAYWHARFADQRMRGEWFRLRAADVRAFRRWRRIY